MSARIAVVGAGVVGLSVAWRLAGRGASVDVFDAGDVPGGRPHAASWASAGFLAPCVDLPAVLRPLDALNRRSAALWPAFAAELEAVSGIDVALRREGTLVVAMGAEEVRELRTTHDAHAGDVTLSQRWLDANEIAALEPALAGVAAARWSGDDVQVDNRRVLAALAECARRAGARLHPRTPVSLDVADTGESGVPPRVVRPAPDGSTAYDAVLVAAGAWSGTLPGLPAPVAVRPVAGEMLALRMPAEAPLLRHVVLTPDVYLVPRRDGRLLVGATVAERGFDAPTTAGGVHALLSGVRRVLPGADALPLVELWSGFRPGSPDGAPLLGWLGARAGRVAVAAGHHRNGILQTPATADAMAALLLGEDTPAWLADFAPDRFRR